MHQRLHRASKGRNLADNLLNLLRLCQITRHRRDKWLRALPSIPAEGQNMVSSRHQTTDKRDTNATRSPGYKGQRAG
ncbi:hypothetical protein AA0473_1336 [Acetobacter orleanensis NRIC 0473]|nr:hypothetical protein AA0473_1336 [Acetobacter orleanensis NRIC 0473]